MKRKFSKSIKNQLIFLLSVSAIVGVLLTTVIVFSYNFYANKKQTLNASYLMTSIMAENLPASIVFDDQQTATNILSTLSLDSSINAAIVYLEDNQIFAEYLKPEIDKQHYANKVNSLMKNSIEAESIEYLDTDFIITASPINFQNDTLAKLVIVADTDRLKELFLNQLITMLAVVFIAILIVGLWSTRLQKIFTAPIYLLLDKMNLVTKHNKYNISVTTDRQDEFLSLFSGFNEMIATINNRTAELNLAKKEIEEAHLKTQDSIKYASLIQQALIPDQQLLNDFFADSFNLWQPKDIVGGDIFFFEKLQNENQAIMFIIDCTGHGVPGSLVTMLVKAVERQVITEIMNNPQTEVNPGIILSLFNKNLKQFLKQEQSDATNNIGFDGAVLFIDKQAQQISYAGSNTPLYYINQDDKLIELKPDKRSVAHTRTSFDYEFTQQQFEYQPGLVIYVTTDGYVDQMGGEKGFSFGKCRFTKLIKQIYQQDMQAQKQLFNQALLDYQQDYERNDDITLVGFKL